MGNVAQEKHDTIGPDTGKDEVVSGVMNKDPEGVVNNGSDRVTDDQGGPCGEMRGGDDGERNLEENQGEGPERCGGVIVEEGGDFRVSLEDLRATLTVRMFAVLGACDDSLGSFGGEKVATRGGFRVGALGAFPHGFENVLFSFGAVGGGGGGEEAEKKVWLEAIGDGGSEAVKKERAARVRGLRQACQACQVPAMRDKGGGVAVDRVGARGERKKIEMGNK